MKAKNFVKLDILKAISLPSRKNIRQFERDYSLALTGSLIFIIILTGTLIVRAQEHSVLVHILTDAASSGQDYSSLISSDVPEEIKRDNNAQADEATNPQSARVQRGTTTVNTISPGVPTPPGGANQSPKALFTSSISSFTQGNSSVTCTGQQQNNGTCNKTYTFSGSIRTLNGPGVVNYGWVSNTAGVNETKSYNASAGQAFTTVQKAITLQCSQASTFTLQLAVASPTLASSEIITVNHSKCF
jgi:hypothetical protein